MRNIPNEFEGKLDLVQKIMDRELTPLQREAVIKYYMEDMTLEELSETYREAAKPLRERLQQLRMELVTETDPLNAYSLKTRIAQMTPILTQLNELAELTEHYYERGYWRSGKYTQ